MHRISVSVALFVILVGALGCSGGSGEIPIDPVSPSIDAPMEPQIQRSSEDSSALLWGYYDLMVNPETFEITVAANRSLEFALNVVPFLNPKPDGIQIAMNGAYPGSGFVDVDLDVTIKHPLELEKFNGYDVRGIFIGQGSSSLTYNSDLTAPDMSTEQVLLNADGYTRWWNPTEFTEEGIMGYKPGRFATPGYMGTATLNPYRYFGDSLPSHVELWSYLISGNDTVGYFLNGTSNTRNYAIRFPVPLPGIKYGYAVVASWEGGPPEYHPAHATEAVGADVEDRSTLYYVNETDSGGYLEFDLGIFDWHSELNAGVMEDYTIIVESTVLSGPHVFTTDEMTPTASSDHVNYYHLRIPADNVTGTEGNEMWVLVEYADADYVSPYGIPNAAGSDPLTAAFRYDLDVSNEPGEPSISVTVPNGGEEWPIGTFQTIQWTSENVSGPVKIEYSKDDFVSDINVIEESTENDGEYDWTTVPDDPSSTVGIRISSVDDPGVFDVSDNYFSIIDCYLDITYPAGGEEIPAGTALDVTYDYLNVGELTFVYSKDGFVSDYNIIGSQDIPTGSYPWDPVPQDPSETVSLRVFWVDQPVISSTSEEFTIYQSGIEVTSPNGGESWGVGRTEEITWTSENVTGTVDIQYSKDEFDGDIHDIAMAEENDSSFMWEIPIDLTDEARIRVRSTDTPGIFDISDGAFSIVEVGWAISLPTAELSENMVDSVATDSEGNIYVAGYAYPDEAGTLFIRMYNRYGQLMWTRNMGDPACTGMIPDCMAVYDSNVIITGMFRGSIDFYPEGAGGEHSTGDAYESFILLLTATGEYVDSVSWAAIDLEGMTLDSLGNIYVCGYFLNTVDFDPDPDDEYEMTCYGAADAWLSCFTPSLDHVSSCHWGGSGLVVAFDVVYDSSGDELLICGGFEGVNADFDPGTGTAYHSAVAYVDSYLLILQTDNTYVDSVAWGGTSDDVATSVEISSSGYIYVGGIFAGTVDFDWHPVVQDRRTAVGESDCYYLICQPNLSYYGVAVVSSNGEDRTLCTTMGDDDQLYCLGLFDGDEIDLDPWVGDDIRQLQGTRDLYLIAMGPLGLYSWGHTIEDGSIFQPCSAIATFDSDFIVVGAGIPGADIELAPVEPPCMEDSDTHGEHGMQIGYILKYMGNGCW